MAKVNDETSLQVLRKILMMMIYKWLKQFNLDFDQDIYMYVLIYVYLAYWSTCLIDKRIHFSWVKPLYFGILAILKMKIIHQILFFAMLRINE